MPEDLKHNRSSRSQAAMERRRQDILQAAISHFHAKGYLGATTDEIADTAGVTKRTLYRHMGSKQRLLLEIHENFIEEGLRRWHAVMDQGGSPPELLRNLIVEHVRTVADHQHAIRVFFEEIKHLNPEDRDDIIRHRDTYEKLLHETLKAGMRSGEFRKLDAKLTTLIVLGALTEVYRWYDPGGPMSANELGEFLADNLMGGIRA